MPEGDTIHRAAAALGEALTGRTILRFDSVFPRLTRIDIDRPLRGRTIERVTSRGKHLLIWFSGDLVLRTHMRMKGAWHLYKPGERWQRPRHDMRIVISTDAVEAVAFNVPVAEFGSARDTERALAALGPDLLADDFDAGDAVTRIAGRADAAIADALLDQGAVAGIGNVYKSETLFAAGIHPFTAVRELPQAAIERIVSIARTMMRANTSRGMSRTSAARRTTGRMNPAERLWVYGRAGRPCRRCGTLIRRSVHGPGARATYWCERCQREPGSS